MPAVLRDDDDDGTACHSRSDVLRRLRLASVVVVVVAVVVVVVAAVVAIAAAGDSRRRKRRRKRTGNENEDPDGTNSDNNNSDNNNHPKDDAASREAADVLVRRIRANDPKLTTLALKNNAGVVRWQPRQRQRQRQGQPHRPQQQRDRSSGGGRADRGRPSALSSSSSSSSYFCGFTRTSIQQATEALHSNHTIRSVSCRYHWRCPRIVRRLRNGNDETDNDETDNDNVDYHELGATASNNNNTNNDNDNNNTVTKWQERRFFEACVCLPRLESISLTGGNRWRISHLVTILETAKRLKRLTIRDLLIRSPDESNGLKKVLLHGGAGGSPVPLESIDLTVEDQTDRDGHDAYWSTEELSPFDALLRALAASPNVREIAVSKSILSRFHLRPVVRDVSAQTLLALAGGRSLAKLVLSGTSVGDGAVEAMCESLTERNGHLRHLEFSGCAFHHTVGRSGWDAMFRLVDRDPEIEIRASSLVYLRRAATTGGHRKGSSLCRSSLPLGGGGGSGDNERCVRGDKEGALPQQRGRPPWRRSLLPRPPREDFTFALRDKESAEKHFQNRGLDIEYTLQDAGFFRLLVCGGGGGNINNNNNNNSNKQRQQQSTTSDWIDVMAKVKDDSIALFYVLRENPALCDRDRNETEAPRQQLPTKATARGEAGEATGAAAVDFGVARHQKTNPSPSPPATPPTAAAATVG